MKNTLQEQYNLIKEGKGAKDVFLKHAKSLFPHLVPNHYGFDTAAQILTQRGIISENVWGITTGNSQQPDWFKLFNENIHNTAQMGGILGSRNYSAEDEEDKEAVSKIKALIQSGVDKEEAIEKIADEYRLRSSYLSRKYNLYKNITEAKAEEKKISKEVEEYEEKSYDNQYGAETGDDVIFDQYLNGIQIEICNPKNVDKTVDEIKKIVLKNLKKDKLYYTKNAAFGIEGIGYTDEAPGLGKTKEVKGKYASSGMEPVKLKESLNEVNMEEYIVWIQPEGEKRRVHHRAKSKPEAERIARMVYGNYYDDYNPPKIGIMPAREWSQETSLDMNIQESSTLFRNPIELAKAVANKHGQELKQLKDQGYKVFEPAAINYGGQTMKDSGMEMVVIKNLLYGYADEDWPSEYIDELSNLLKNLNESKLRSAIRSLIKEELNLKEIDQVGEDASKEAKIKRMNEEINKRKKKLKALETLKELEEDSVNPKKIKELYSEIKKLEAAKNKLEKKGKKKEQIVDETAVVSDKTTPDEISSIASTGDTTKAAVTAAVKQAQLTKKPVTVA